jgi:hypothetical protein
MTTNSYHFHVGFVPTHLAHIKEKKSVCSCFGPPNTYNHKLTIPDKFAKERNYIQKKDSVKTKD